MSNNTWATIKIYNGVPFTKDKNFAVDDIAAYLSAIPATRCLDFSDYEFNYFKQGVSATLKIQLDQNALSFNASNYNYAEITNWRNPGIPDKKVYYFIDSMSWTSKSVITLSLTMDTVNTLGLLPLTDKTLIHRQHKNRFFVAGGRAKGIIDKAKEGIDTILYKTNNNILKPKQNYMQGKWYLAYITKNNPVASDYEQINPVITLLLPEHKTYVQLAGLGGSDISVQTTFTFYKYYTFSSNLNGPLGVSITPEGTGHPYRNYKIYDAIPERTDGPSAHRVYYYLTLNWLTTKGVFEYVRSVVNSSGVILSTTTLETGEIVTYAGGEGTVTGHINISCNKSLFYYWEGNSNHQNPLLEPTYTQYTNKMQMGGIADIDRTDPKIIKIVELPYCPLEILEPAISTGGIVFNSRFSYGNYFILSGNTNYFLSIPSEFTTQSCEIETNLNGFNETTYMDFDPTTKHKTDLRNGNYELKLYNSEFYGRKFVYDSFSYTFKYEEANISATYTAMQNKFKFKMLTSLAVTSKFAFDFTPSWKIAQVTEDYPNILPIARNNEIPIYNSQYLTYLRTGLQYDLKAREREKEKDIGQVIFSAVGGLAGAALGVASGNYAVAAAGVISAATSITSSIVSAVNRSITAQQSLEQKIAQLKAQSATVQASDDLDLMRGYTEGNWAKIELYQPSTNMSQCLFDLFFYTGYKCEYMERPALDTRNRFNFISATIDIDTEVAGYIYQNYTEEIINDYKARFENGLTIIHHYNNEWDFDQKYENWETILENYLQ